ncbi:MAG: S41 family peptidase, partial [Saprospiraceae bacterium]|nr:S41 family peptidase [Saprospiraceae bacterium]
ERMEGHFEGIGIEFHLVRDTITVLDITEGGPADRAGVRPHDRIISADDSTLVGIELSEELVVNRLRGPKGSPVSIAVRRHGVDTLISLTIVRDEIPIVSVDAAYMLDDETGYIRINRFSSTTYKEFMDRLESLVKDHGMQHVVIDLRQNPGGYLKEAVNILSQLFAEKGRLLVYTEGEHTKRMDYESTGNPFYPVGNIAVLIDGGSASASEIIAGAIQDQDRGVIIGTKSFGKGLVQEQYALKNGGALRLTTARYYTPSGRSIQKPYRNGDSVDQAEDADSTGFQTRNGREVFGSGGIIPDIIVEPGFDWYQDELGSLYEAVLEYAFYGYKEIHQQRYASVSDLMRNFPERDYVLQSVIGYWERTSADWPHRELVTAHWDQGYALLQAMIGSYYFGREAWYQIMNERDPVVDQARESVRQDRRTTLKI